MVKYILLILRGGGIINIQYKSTKVENYCNLYSVAKKKFNEQVAPHLIALVNLMKNSSNLEDINKLQNYNIHHLHGGTKGKRIFGVDVAGRDSGWRMQIILLDDSGEQTDTDSNTTYADIKSIKIMEVGMHYG